MVGHAVQLRAHLHDRAGFRHLGVKYLGAVRLGEDRLAQIQPDLARIDVERGDEFDVADLVSTDVFMDQPVGGVAGGIVILALHQAARAVADPDDGDLDPRH